MNERMLNDELKYIHNIEQKMHVYVCLSQELLPNGER